MNRLQWILALGVWAFGMAVGDWDSVNLNRIILAPIVFSVPLLLQLTPWKTVRVYALWFGVFLVLQTLVSPFVLKKTRFTFHDFLHLPPHLKLRLDVQGDNLPGIQGIQNISTDRMGFRVTKNVDYESKPEGVFRVFAIGGSTTEQIHVDDRRTWTHLLQERLERDGVEKEVEVINTGLSGLRARNHLATLDHVAQYEPDLVLFLAGINDWNRQIAAHFESAKGLLAELRYALRFSHTLLGETARIAFYRIRESRVDPSEEPGIQTERGEEYAERNDSLNRRTDRRSFRPSEVSEEYRDDMEKIARTCKTKGIPCMMITQPTAYRSGADEAMKSYFWMTPPYQSYTLDFDSLVHVAALYNRYTVSLAESHGLGRCDPVGGIEPSLEDFYDDCHLNLRGSVLMSSQVAECISDFLASPPPAR